MSGTNLARVDGREQANVARHLRNYAKDEPQRTALIAKPVLGSTHRYEITNFEQLDELSDRVASGLSSEGVRARDKVLLLVPPGVEFIVLWFAILKLGAVVVLIDPGMGGKNLAKCIDDVQPDVFIGIERAHLLRFYLRSSFKSVTKLFTVGKRWFWGGGSYESLKLAKRLDDMQVVEAEHPAAIVFTTGSTGVPKGVLYSHRTIDAQINLLREVLQVSDGDVGFSAFLPFALFCVAMGTPCIMPDINPRRPADADPQKMHSLIEAYRPSYALGSPAFWKVVAEYLEENELKFSTLERIAMFGAPIRAEVLRSISAVTHSEGQTYTPYGATEALPITSIGSTEILADTMKSTENGGGVCVGYPLSDLDIRIIAINDRAISTWDEVEHLPTGEIGEVVVCGSVVSERYVGREQANELGKIEQQGRVWHRMGDVGYFDSLGRLWFCGRKAHRVTTDNGNMYTVPCEWIFNQHSAVRRSALVGVGPRGGQRPVIIIERNSESLSTSDQQLERELLELAKTHDHTSSIETIMFYPDFPVDFRHNAKIIREQLAIWATEQMKI